MCDAEKIDVIILGATGYTGKRIVREFILINENKCSWAVAGRNQKKLHEVLELASIETGLDVTKIPIIICDCEDEVSLNKMAQRGRMIINCCGPYRFYGEPVIKACIENGAHQIDMSAEPEHMETIQLKYHETAEKNGVYIVSACGFDTVASELGIIHFTNNFPGQVNSIEAYGNYSPEIFTSGKPMANRGTWESGVYLFVNEQNLVEIRKKLYPLLSPPELKPVLKSGSIHRCELFNNNYAVPLPEPDQSVVFRTQMFMRNYYKQRPVQYRPYFVCPSLIVLAIIFFSCHFLLFFIKFGFCRRLVLKYPEFFSCGLISKTGPSEEALSNSLAHVKLKGEGWTEEIADQFENKEEINVPPNKRMVTEAIFKNPGYGFTLKSVVYSAFTILKESDKMPSRGGVYTPGGAFSRTSFFDQLMKTEVHFKILPNN